MRIVRSLVAWLAPGGLVLGAVAFWIWRTPSLAAAEPEFYPSVVFGAAALLAWWFHRGRTVFATLLLAAADGALWYLQSPGSVSPAPEALAFQALAFLLPVNLVFLTLLPERGLASTGGLVTAGLLLAQGIAVAILLHSQPAQVRSWLATRWIDPGGLPFHHLSQPALAAFLLAALGLAGLALRRGGPAERGAFWALAAAFLSLAFQGTSPVGRLYLAAGGGILGLSVIQTSHALAYQDSLTGLPGRRALVEALAGMGKAYTVAMVDVDHFKKVNDRHGHDVGDQVLKMVASRLAETAGDGRPFRYGGEEFTLLFPGLAAAQARPLADAARRAIADSAFTLRSHRRPREKPARPKRKGVGDKRLSVTVSIGLAERSEKHPTPEQVLKAADRALYRAKKAGRNRVRQ